MLKADASAIQPDNKKALVRAATLAGAVQNTKPFKKVFAELLYHACCLFGIPEERKYIQMQREELVTKWSEIIGNLNTEGLQMIDKLMGGIAGMEEYNINTTEERIAEIKKEREARLLVETEERRAKQEKAQFDRMQREIAERKDKIASFTGRELTFWNKIAKVKQMKDISRYCMVYWQTMLIAELYNNNYINASYTEFCYGFYQGMQYMKNKKRKEKQGA